MGRKADNLKVQLKFALHCDSQERLEEYIGISKEISLTHDSNIGVEEITIYKAVLWSELCVHCLYQYDRTLLYYYLGKFDVIQGKLEERMLRVLPLHLNSQRQMKQPPD